MRDDSESDQKAFSTKSVSNALTGQPPVAVHDKLANARNQHLLPKKSIKEAPRKKSAASKSRTQPQQAAVRDQKEERSASLAEIQLFVRKLIDDAFDQAVAHEAARKQKPADPSEASKTKSGETAEETKSRSRDSAADAQEKAETGKGCPSQLGGLTEDLGVILARQKH